MKPSEYQMKLAIVVKGKMEFKIYEQTGGHDEKYS